MSASHPGDPTIRDSRTSIGGRRDKRAGPRRARLRRGHAGDETFGISNRVPAIDVLSFFASSGKFVGIIGESPFTSITFDETVLRGSEQFGADNLYFAAPAPTAVPEPGTLALFGAGLAGVGLLRRRR